LRQAVRIDPKFAVAHYNLGIALDAGGRTDQAIDHLRQAVRINPRFAAAHNNLGVVLCKKGRPEQAIDHLRQAIRINPRSASVHMSLGGALYAAARDAVLAAARKGPQKGQLGEPERAARRRKRWPGCGPAWSSRPGC
jgi:Tfp pilus assembly protein PilF